MALWRTEPSRIGTAPTSSKLLLDDILDSSKHDGKDNSLKDIYLVNSLNKTTVAAWDLQSPDQQDPSTVSRQRKTESLGMAGDRRAKVASKHLRPGGKYRSICKLFMAYSRSDGYEYIGTGWLIADNVVVTAGHCLYDSQGGYLKYIKAYIGYVGPEGTAMSRNSCQMRLGKFAACPIEYIKAQHTVHDVGFIQLESPFDDVESFKPEDTPKALKGVDLGVVGYPGDIDGGNYMYEHWAVTKFDIAQNGYLSYEIDTEHGESGSPVLRRLTPSDQFQPIGVHTDGGFPNAGSAIGPLGNLFSDYTTALKVKDKKKVLPYTSRTAVLKMQSIRNLEYISISAPADHDPSINSLTSLGKGMTNGFPDHLLNDLASRGKETSRSLLNGLATRGKETSGGHMILSDDESSEDLDEKKRGLVEGSSRLQEAHKALRNLENLANPAFRKPEARFDGSRGSLRDRILQHAGSHDNWNPIGTSSSRAISGGLTADMRTRAPEKLPAHAWKESGTITGKTQEQLLEDAQNRVEANPDIPTTFFIDFPPKFEGEALVELQRVKKNVALWQSWASSLAATKVQEKINSGELSEGKDASSKARISTYYSMVFDFLLRGSTWFAKTYDEVQQSKFECKKAEFHTQLVTTILAGFSVPSSVVSGLHKALDTISKGMATASSTNSSQSMQYFIMLTRYEWQAPSQTMQPIVRVISFKTDASLNKYSFMKNSVEFVKLNFTYNQYQCDFNDEIFSQIRGNISGVLVAGGNAFIDKAAKLEIQIPPAFKESKRPFFGVPKIPHAIGVDYLDSTHPLSTLADYGQLTKQLKDLVDAGKVDRTINPSETQGLEIEPFDAGVAALIGTRLALRSQQVLKNNGSLGKITVLITQFPEYWQSMGAHVFRQLFPSVTVPLALKFYDHEEELAKKIDDMTKDYKTMRQILDTERKAAEGLKEQLSARSTEVKSLEDYIKFLGGKTTLEPGADEQTLKAQPQEFDDLKANYEQLQKDLQQQQGNGQALTQQLEVTRKERDKAISESTTLKSELNYALAPKETGTVDLFASGELIKNVPYKLLSPVSFETPLELAPTIIHGISELISAKPNPAISSVVTKYNGEGFALMQRTEHILLAFKSNWLSVANLDIALEAGSFKAGKGGGQGTIATNATSLETQIESANEFSKAPIVGVFLQGFASPDSQRSIEVATKNMTPKNFTLSVTWSSAGLSSFDVGWIAYDANTTKIRSGYVLSKASQPNKHALKFGDSPFQHPPRLFTALSGLGRIKATSFTFKVEHKSTTKDSMELYVTKDNGTGNEGWESVSCFWLAIE